MKKILFSLIVLCMAVFACKKENSKNTNLVLSTHKVAFRVGFSQQLSSFSTNRLTTNSVSTNSADTSLTNHIDILYYAVYDSSGNSLHTIKQLSSDPAFGSYTDNLLAGKYTVVIAGGKTGLLLGSDGFGTTTSTLNKDVISYGFYTVDPFIRWNAFDKDAFYKKLSITVTNSNSSQNVVLDRIVSQLVVNIQDAIPSNARTMGIIPSESTGAIFYVGSGTSKSIPSLGTPLSLFDTLKNTDIGTKHYQLKMLFLYATPISVNLFCSSNLTFGGYVSVQPNAIAEKIISNVTGQANTQTVLTGNLFGGAVTGSTGGFALNIDTTWNTTPITKTFP